jgi:hypothetical protein
MISIAILIVFNSEVVGIIINITIDKMFTINGYCMVCICTYIIYTVYIFIIPGGINKRNRSTKAGDVCIIKAI